MRSANVIPAIAERLLDTVYSAIKITGPTKFKVGDSVRMNKYKTIFEKGYTPNWTIECLQSLSSSVPISSTNLSTRGLSQKIRRWSVLRARVA